MSEPKRLWEYDHPYYCSESNYYSNKCHSDWDSWADFIAEFGASDMDMNLVFRWDWKVGEEGEEDEGEHTLHVFFMGQRKGLFFATLTHVTPDDEPAVRAWLTERAAHMRLLWAPLLDAPQPVPQVEQPPARADGQQHGDDGEGV